ncbi:unnamed protein product [[Candida] boidinii]|uniref:Unnamed protein product n=1 Tax=Candida boidinii TaxID=5477 RepID=A0ACB5TZB5_CANBO|nr:unnamed protein product [[Candida] boidinii]
MSHSLISIPKFQFLNSTNNFNLILNKNYLNLYYLKENLNDSKFELKETCGKILKLNDLINQSNNSLIDYRDWIINLNNLIPIEFKSISQNHYYNNNDYDSINSNEINSKFLNNLTIDLNSKIYKYEIINSNYINLIKNSIDLENKLLLKNSSSSSSKKSSYYYYYYYYFKPILGNSIQLIPIGKFLNDLLPRLLLIPILLNLFNVWDYLKKWFNGVFFLDYFFDEFEFNDEIDEVNNHNHQENNDQLDIENDGSTIENRRDLLKIKESKKIINQYLKDNNINDNNGIINNNNNNNNNNNRFGISDNQLRTLNLTSNHYSDNDTINDNDNSYSNRVLGDTTITSNEFPIPSYNKQI